MESGPVGLCLKIAPAGGGYLLRKWTGTRESGSQDTMLGAYYQAIQSKAHMAHECRAGVKT